MYQLLSETVVSIALLCQLQLVTQLHKSKAVSKHLSNQGSYYEKTLMISITQRKPSCATTESMLFTFIKDEWNTKENTGKSLKNDMHVLQYTKRHTRNGCDGKLIAKILIATILVNFVLNPSEMWRRLHKFSRIVVIRIFIINFPSQPFLDCHLGFHIFFHKGLLGGHTLFYSWAVFWIICLSALEVHDAIHMLQ